MSILTNESRINASKQAHLNLKIWECALSFRISLQKTLEIANKLPLTNTSSDAESLTTKSTLQSTIESLYSMLQSTTETAKEQTKRNKRKREVIFDDICSQHETNSLKWKEVLNKWNSRLHFGDKDSQSKMKTFKQTYWEQVLITL